MKEIRFEKTKNGVTIWVGDEWIMDASDFLFDHQVTISSKMHLIQDEVQPNDFVYEWRGKK